MDVVSYLTFATEEIVDREDLERGEMHKARIKCAPKQSTVITAFRTEVPAIFGGPKVGWDKNDPPTAICMPELWERAMG